MNIVGDSVSQNDEQTLNKTYFVFDHKINSNLFQAAEIFRIWRLYSKDCILIDGDIPNMIPIIPHVANISPLDIVNTITEAGGLGPPQ